MQTQIYLLTYLLVNILSAVTESGNDTRSAARLRGRNNDLMLTRPAKVNCIVTSRQWPDDVSTVGTSSRRPGVKTSQVTDELSDKDIELQQQLYISRLIASKPSSCQQHPHSHGSRHSVTAGDALSHGMSRLTH